MQVNQVNSLVPRKLNNQRNNKAEQNNNNLKNRTASKESFEGAVDTLSLGVANAIENGGLAVSFTLQDMLGTNLPRPIMGLMRNSKENDGQKNFSFAAKELVREMLTGPSMFLIPMTLLGVGKKAIGKTIDVPMKALKSFGEVHAANPLNEAGKAIGKQDFYKNAFAEMIKNAKAETEITKETAATAAEFAEKLASATGKSKVKETVAELGAKFVDITKSHASDAVHTDFTQAVVAGSKSSFKDAVSNMMSYADDVVVKASKNATAQNINKIVNHNVVRRLAVNAGMYAAVMTFLQVIPKMYNKAEGDKNAGLKGLMTEETFGASSSAKTNQSGKTETANDNVKTDGDKSKPSFGSSAAFAKTLTGNGIVGKMAQGIEFEGSNVSFPLLLGVMGLGILLPRTLNAKDKYDREEIVRRDVTTCVTMCFAEKALRKGFSKVNEARSGFALANKPQGFKDQNIFKKAFDYLRPIKGVNVLDSQQIVAKYSDIDKYKDGVKGFCDFISGQGGNLSKVFSLTDESKNLVQGMLGEGKDIAKASNEEITKALESAKGSESLQKLTDLFKLRDKTSSSALEKLFRLNKGKTNPWIEKAKTLNARFTALSVLVLVPAFLGFLLPWINEKATKKRVNEELANKNNDLNNVNNFQQTSPKVFEDITNFSKKA